MTGPHPTHVTRFSDASTFDEVCVNCGATDRVPGGWGRLAFPCPNAPTEPVVEVEGAPKVDHGEPEVDPEDPPL